MRTIRSLLAPVLVCAVLATVAVPAAAQRGGEIHARMDQIAMRIDRNEARGRLSHREARRLRDELGSIRQQEERMRRDGRLEGRERQMLERRLSRLDERVSDARR
ncbi:MAG TPA: hypothetical protein VHA82_09395 [Ramlibacter sp.]|uniref:hypothetical protein n=1 Tax=Ramlibacter sp. TaxID=1917967 RepID=UPI002C583475|nr:hypothetical protein [Ramlibacter sp.]HVZ44013.1 hypothetical protein [Ramlibacter sp.]